MMRLQGPDSFSAPTREPDIPRPSQFGAIQPHAMNDGGMPSSQSEVGACRLAVTHFSWRELSSMAIAENRRAPDNWCCLECRSLLTFGDLGWRCPSCGEQYPSIAGIPLLVASPALYLRSERASLLEASRKAQLRREWLDRNSRNTGLPSITLVRNRDVLDAEIAIAETFLALLEPAAPTADVAEKSVDARRSGWSLEIMYPYLLRDWRNTPELREASSRIGLALKHVFSDSSGKSVVFAGCGAGGLLAEVSPDFGHVLGFDLTLPLLAAARRLLDGETIDLAVPRAMNQQGYVTLHRNDPGANHSRVGLVAMDALDTAFPDASVDCVVTAFLTDIMPDPRRLANEIHRILSSDGVWINYGPSGNLKMLWRFDQSEGAAFFEAAGFAVVQRDAYRTTNLDISRDCPSESYRNVMCYLTTARKTGVGERTWEAAMPSPQELPKIVPQHLPGASLVQRLGELAAHRIAFHYEPVGGRGENLEIGRKAARILALVDGKRTTYEIAQLLSLRPQEQPIEETLRAFGRYFEQGILSWSGPIND
jgi:SAM-dependent methyltransferase